MGKGTIERLAEFAAGDSALPPSVLEYTKLVLADTIISGRGARNLERYAMVAKMADRLGGSDGATVIGKADRVGVLSAAYANADIFNLLDADETFHNSAHFAAMGIAAALAEGERRDVTGKALLRAVAISFDVSARLNLMTSLIGLQEGEVQFSRLSSHGYASLGAATAYAVAAGLGPEQTAHALALATWLAPTAKNGYMSRRRKFNSLKYAPNGQISGAGITAAMMAEEGFKGDLDSLDLDPGFIEAQGYSRTSFNPLEELGETWWISETSIKPYPACRYTNAALDAITAFMEERPDFDATSVQKVNVCLSPAAYSVSQFHDPHYEIEDDHIAPFQLQFNVPFLVALTLLGYENVEEWFDPTILNTEDVRSLAEKVNTSLDADLDAEWKRELREGGAAKHKRTRGNLQIQTETETIELCTEFAMGDPWEERTRPTWELLEGKAERLRLRGEKVEVERALLSWLQGLDEVAGVRNGLHKFLSQ